MADAALADFAATEGKTVIELSEEEAARFNEVSSEVTEQIVADAEAEGIAAQAYVSALRGN